MRIIVVEPDGFGGLAHFAYQVANALADAGADVTLLTSREYELAALPHRCRLDASLNLWRSVADEPAWLRHWPSALRRVRHRLRRLPRAVRLLRVWIGLTYRLVRERPDAVQFSQIRFPVLGTFFRVMHRAGLTVTLVCHEFEMRDGGEAGATRPRASCRAYASCAVIFFLGERVRTEFLRQCAAFGGETAVLPPPGPALAALVDAGAADCRARYGLESGAPVALFFGGLRPSKGIDDLIAAFAHVVRHVPAARLLVVGLPSAGLEVSRYVAQARALGIGQAVVVDPRYVPLEQVATLMRSADVVVLPYRSATWSGVAQMAVTCGRAVVATRVGTLPEVIEDGVTGRLVEAGDVAALGEAVLALLRDPAGAESMGMAARSAMAAGPGWPEVARTILAATAATRVRRDPSDASRRP